MIKPLLEAGKLLSKPYLLVKTSLLLLAILLSGCSSLQLSQVFQPVNVDKLSVYDQTRLNCSIQTGLQSENDFALLASGIVSVGFRLPTSVDQDFNYDRKLDDYRDCLRVDGL